MHEDLPHYEVRGLLTSRCQTQDSLIARMLSGIGDVALICLIGGEVSQPAIIEVNVTLSIG
jgi:hypothetical protein